MITKGTKMATKQKRKAKAKKAVQISETTKAYEAIVSGQDIEFIFTNPNENIIGFTGKEEDAPVKLTAWQRFKKLFNRK